jgi:hypothetical protein
MVTGEGSRLTPKALEKILARASTEVGNLSYYEQAGTTQPRDIWSRLMQSIETAASGQMTDDTKAEIIGLANAYEQAARNAMASVRKKHASQGAGAYSSLGLNEGDLSSKLTASDLLTPAPAKTETLDERLSRMEAENKKMQAEAEALRNKSKK